MTGNWASALCLNFTKIFTTLILVLLTKNVWCGHPKKWLVHIAYSSWTNWTMPIEPFFDSLKLKCGKIRKFQEKRREFEINLSFTNCWLSSCDFWKIWDSAGQHGMGLLINNSEETQGKHINNLFKLSAIIQIVDLDQFRW